MIFMLHTDGEVRAYKSYCIFPRSWEGKVYWLEHVIITERYQKYTNNPQGPGPWKRISITKCQD